MVWRHDGAVWPGGAGNRYQRRKEERKNVVAHRHSAVRAAAASEHVAEKKDIRRWADIKLRNGGGKRCGVSIVAALATGSDAPLQRRYGDSI